MVFEDVLRRPENRQKAMGLGRAQELSRARQGAEQQYPFLEAFKNVKLDYPIVPQKGGMGEFYMPGEPGSPNPFEPTIAVGPASKNLQGGMSDTVTADMVHASFQFSPELRTLKEELVKNLSPRELDFAKRIYEAEYKNISGTNFATFDNFLRSFWVEGMVQHLLIPENSEIEDIKRNNPNAIPILNKIKSMFLKK